MEEINFLVQGSAPEPYEVTFLWDGSRLSALCTCPAGQNGQYCKHRIGILENTPSGIVSDNSESISQVLSWLEGTTLESALSEYRQADEALVDAKKLSAAKKTLARVMRE